MKRSPAMRIRMDLAKKTDPADLQSLVKTAQEIEALKDRVCEMGFIFTKPVDARLVTHTFPPEDEELVDPPAEGG